MYERILVAVNGSESSQRACEEACALAREQRAALRLIHVVDHRALVPEAVWPRPAALRAELRAAGRRVLDTALARAAAAGTAAEGQLLESDGAPVAGVIAEAARRWPADLVVAGSRAPDGVAGAWSAFLAALVPPVADEIAHAAPCPVLLVRPERSRGIPAAADAAATALVTG